MIGAVKAKIRQYPGAPELSFRLPIGGLCELYANTGLSPGQLISKLSGDEDEDEQTEDVLGDFISFSSKTAEFEQIIKAIIEVAFEWGRNPSHVEFKHEVSPAFEFGRGTTLLALAGKILTASAGALPNDPYPQSEAGEGSGDSFAPSVFYQAAGALGIDPKAVLEMTLWEFAQYSHGKTASTSEGALSQAEVDAISKALDEFEAENSQ